MQPSCKVIPYQIRTISNLSEPRSNLPEAKSNLAAYNLLRRLHGSSLSEPGSSLLEARSNLPALQNSQICEFSKLRNCEFANFQILINVEIKIVVNVVIKIADQVCDSNVADPIQSRSRSCSPPCMLCTRSRLACEYMNI